MFHTSLSEMAAGVTASGKKSVPKGGGTSLRQNFEFQRLLRDVENEMSMIKKGVKGNTRADGHPKMAKTLDLVSNADTTGPEITADAGVVVGTFHAGCRG